MPYPTHSSQDQDKDLQIFSVANSSSKRQSFQGWRFVRWMSGITVVALLILTALFTWQSKSPHLSFLIFKFGLLTQTNFVAKTVTDKSKLVSALSDQLLPLLLDETLSRPDAQWSAADRVKQEAMIQTFRSILPSLLSSFRSINGVALSTQSGVRSNDYVLKNILPMALHIQPDIWSQWWVEITTGHFHMGECRFAPANDRAACELVIQGPLKQSATLALLWEKDGWLWRLQGLDGLDRLLAAMRATPKLP